MKTRMASFQRVKTPQNPSICCAKKVPTVCQITKLQRSIGQTRSIACRPGGPLQELWCKGSLRPRSRRATGMQKCTNIHACMSQSTYPYIRISHIVGLRTPAMPQGFLLFLLLLLLLLLFFFFLFLFLLLLLLPKTHYQALKILNTETIGIPPTVRVSFEVWWYSEVFQPANMVMPWASTWGSGVAFWVANPQELH